MPDRASGVGVKGSTERLFKILKFKDDNKNGVIEEKGISNLWTAEENYNKDADIDFDGNIVVAEAKYYLRSLKSVDKATKDEFALTDGDKRELKDIVKHGLTMANAHPSLNEDETVDNFLKILNTMNHLSFDAAEKKEIIDAALESLDPMLMTRAKAIETSFLAAEMQRIGYPEEKVVKVFKDAMKASLGLMTQDDKMLAIVNLVTALEQSGLRGQMVNAVLDSGYDIVKEEEADLKKRSAEMSLLGLAYSRSSVAKERESAMFAMALKAARSIQEPDKRSEALRNIASCMKKAGRTEEAKTICQEALNVARKVKALVDRAAAIQQVAETMSGVGYDRSEVIAVSKEALETADKAEDGLQKGILLLYINNYISIKRELNRTDTNRRLD